MAWITVSRVFKINEVDYTRLLVGDVFCVVTDFNDLIEYANSTDFLAAVTNKVIGLGDLCFLEGKVRKVMQTDIDNS